MNGHRGIIQLWQTIEKNNNMHLVSSGMHKYHVISNVYSNKTSIKILCMTKTTHNRECKLHAQPSGENIMILELDNLEKKVVYFGIKNV